MEAIGGLFSFLRQIVDQRTMVILEITKHAATRWITWSASVVKLVYEFWQQGQTSSANLEDIVGSDNSLRLPGIVEEPFPTTHEEDTVDVVNNKEGVGDKEDTSKLATKTKRGRSRTRYAAPQEAVREQRRRRRAKLAHNGVVKSSKKKGAKGRAAYTLRGVAGKVVKPGGA